MGHGEAAAGLLPAGLAKVLLNSNVSGMEKLEPSVTNTR
jgi:hypothetical protein